LLVSSVLALRVLLLSLLFYGWAFFSPMLGSSRGLYFYHTLTRGCETAVMSPWVCTGPDCRSLVPPMCSLVSDTLCARVLCVPYPSPVSLSACLLCSLMSVSHPRVLAWRPNPSGLGPGPEAQTV